MRQWTRFARAALALSGVALIGCSTSGPHEPGSIMINITAAPDGSTPQVVVSSPTARTDTITATSTLETAPGDYYVAALTTYGLDSVIGYNVDTGHVTGGQVVVTPGSKAVVTVVYATSQRFGGMWVANNAYGTSPFLASSQLRTTGSPIPAETLAAPIGHPAGLAPDGLDNFWESSSSSDTLLMYSLAARNAGGGTPPTTVLVSPALNNAQNLAFDFADNLWVANCGGGNILGYTPAQQAAGGVQAPAITLTSTTVACPYSLIFDSNGNMWVADHGNNLIVEFSAAQVAVGGTVVPVVTIGSNNGSLHSPDAFGGGGDYLWVANDGLNTVVAYSAAQLSASGTPVPSVTITLPATTNPFGLNFDQSNTLWVSDSNHGIMYGLTQAQLTTTGSPTPAIALTLSLGKGFSPEQPLFDFNASPGGTEGSCTRYCKAALSIRGHSNWRRIPAPPR